jgi:hypothetical protein
VNTKERLKAAEIIAISGTWNTKAWKAAKELANHILSAARTDDDPITDEFLLGFGFTRLVGVSRNRFDDWHLSLNSGDSIQIRKYRNPEITNDCWINDDGIHSFPQTKGDVRRLVQALEKEINEL